LPKRKILANKDFINYGLIIGGARLDMDRFKENYQIFKELKKLKGINEQLK